MRLKSNIREKNKPADAIINSSAAAVENISSEYSPPENPATENPALAASEIPAPAPPPEAGVAGDTDDASIALRRQLEALKRSEAVHKNAPQPISREQALRLWRAQGLTEKEINFLEQNSELLANPALLGAAANEAARQGHRRDSAEFFAATKATFSKYLDAPPVTPDFFRPPPAPPPPSGASFVSAPVSRGIPTADRIPVHVDPTRVQLTAGEREVARSSGITDVEYAKHKIRLEREKASGLRQG